LSLFLITRVDNSRGIKEFIHVCVYVCLPHDRAKTTVADLAHHESWLVAIHLILGQGHGVTKCKTYLRRLSGRCEFALYQVAIV